jgi:hypothetical protein
MFMVEMGFYPSPEFLLGLLVARGSGEFCGESLAPSSSRNEIQRMVARGWSPAIREERQSLNRAGDDDQTDANG